MPRRFIEKLFVDCALRPVIATEIEFYLHGAQKRLGIERTLGIIREECVKADIPLASAEEERGPDQYEIALRPSWDVMRIAEDTERFKRLMKEAFYGHGITADFSAKPLTDAPGNGLHVHAHLEDKMGRNMFFRDGEFSPHLLQALGGLLKTMNPCMVFFAPLEASYARFAPHSNAPTTVSWGTNNRTVALRLPTKPLSNKHIEHRVAGSDAESAPVITAILAGIHYGLTQQCDAGEPIYGDASLAQYKRPLLVRSLQEARDYAVRLPFTISMPPLSGGGEAGG